MIALYPNLTQSFPMDPKHSVIRGGGGGGGGLHCTCTMKLIKQKNHDPCEKKTSAV